MGPLFKAVLQSGFTKLRDGDRFYFESKFAAFTIPELAAFTNVTLSSVVLDNTASSTWTWPALERTKSVKSLTTDTTTVPSYSSAPVCLKPVSIQQVPSSSSNGAGPIFPLVGLRRTESERERERRGLKSIQRLSSTDLGLTPCYRMDSRRSLMVSSSCTLTSLPTVCLTS